jgi:hypothetical protein
MTQGGSVNGVLAQVLQQGQAAFGGKAPLRIQLPCRACTMLCQGVCGGLLRLPFFALQRPNAQIQDAFV